MTKDVSSIQSGTMTTRAKRPANKRVLTELFVRKAKPRATAFVVWDLRQRGLCIRTMPSGSKSWFAVYSRHGRPRWLHIGKADAIGLADARVLAAKVMLAVAEGKDPAAEKKAERGSGTFAELAEKYVEQHAKKHNKSWKQAAALVNRFALPRWGKLQAITITRSDVRALVAGIDAPIISNQVLASISAIFSFALNNDLIAANPCRGIERNKTKSRERVLSESEMPLFWKAFGEADPVIGAALKVILLTGQRPGEVAHMRREHLVDGWWQMPGSPEPLWPGTKNAQSHRVWLPQAVQELIAEQGDGAIGFVFAGPRGRAARGLDEAMREACAKLGVERATPHDLRRSFGSTVTGLGFGRQAMDRILNHADHSVGSIYDRYSYSQEDQRIMEKTAAKLLLLAGVVALPDNVLEHSHSFRRG